MELTEHEADDRVKTRPTTTVKITRENYREFTSLVPKSSYISLSEAEVQLSEDELALYKAIWEVSVFHFGFHPGMSNREEISVDVELIERLESNSSIG